MTFELPDEPIKETFLPVEENELTLAEFFEASIELNKFVNKMKYQQFIFEEHTGVINCEQNYQQIAKFLIEKNQALISWGRSAEQVSHLLKGIAKNLREEKK